MNGWEGVVAGAPVKGMAKAHFRCAAQIPSLFFSLYFPMQVLRCVIAMSNLAPIRTRLRSYTCYPRLGCLTEVKLFSYDCPLHKS